MCTVLGKGFYPFLLYLEYYFHFHKVIIHIYDTIFLKRKEKGKFSPAYVMLLLSFFKKLSINCLTSLALDYSVLLTAAENLIKRLSKIMCLYGTL